MLGAEALVVDLGGCLDEVLKMGAGEEVSQIDKFAMSLVLDVNGAPAVLTPPDGFAVDGEAVFAADYGKGDDGLPKPLALRSRKENG